jgi:hypothetical protein
VEYEGFVADASATASAESEGGVEVVVAGVEVVVAASTGDDFAVVYDGAFGDWASVDVLVGYRRSLWDFHCSCLREGGHPLSSGLFYCPKTNQL